MFRGTARTIRIFSLEVSLDFALRDINKSTFQHLTVTWKATSSHNGLNTFLLEPVLENTSFYFRYLHIPLTISKTEKNLKTRVSIFLLKPMHFLKVTKTKKQCSQNTRVSVSPLKPMNVRNYPGEAP